MVFLSSVSATLLYKRLLRVTVGNECQRNKSWTVKASSIQCVYLYNMLLGKDVLPFIFTTQNLLERIFCLFLSNYVG